jgi:FKBP-type peptidyl-prolyl cis-trans isomerase FkpA
MKGIPMASARTRFAFAALAAGALAAGALGQSGSTQPGAGTPQPKPAAQPAAQPATPPQTPPATPAPGAPPAPAAPEQPKALPVPDGPALNKQELEGGVIAEDIKIGDGPVIKLDDTLCFHYHGTLKATGAKFESSFDEGQPAVYPLRDLVPGWQKGIPGMKVGGVRRLTIPSALAYGEQGRPGIPPNADLVFIIQIVSAMQFEDIKVGEGEPAAGSFVAVTSYRILDEQGKEVEKVDATKPYIWLPGEYPAIDFGLTGMKPGGKRKITVPKEINVAPPQAQRMSPLNVPVTVEVELINVRNIGPRRR